MNIGLRAESGFRIVEVKACYATYKESFRDLIFEFI